MAENYTPLASPEDVAAALGRALTTSEQLQVDAFLAQASELFRKVAGRTFTPGRKTSRLKVNGGEVRLPETPVTEVHQVTVDDGAIITYTRFDSTLTVPLRSHSFVRVDYSFGTSDIPELVKTTVAAMAARVFNIDPLAKGGLSQFQTTTGPFSDGGTFATWAVGGQVMLSPADAAVAASLRSPRLSNTVVLR